MQSMMWVIAWVIAYVITGNISTKNIAEFSWCDNRYQLMK